MTPIQLVDTINTGSGSANFTPDSPDPSGLAYIPGQDRLVAVDGEVEETTGAGFHGANGWFVTRQGVSTDTFDTTKAPTSPQDKEPVGAAYDIAKDELYIVKDGSTSRVWVYNASTMAQKRTFAVSGPPYNDADDEGLGFGNGVLYMVDAKDNDLVKVQPGNDGVVGTSDDQVQNFDLQRYGQTEPEGLDVHPVTGNIWVVSNKLVGGQPEPMVEVAPNGDLVASYSIAAANPNSAAGLAIAPPSDGSGGYDIYVADRGIDNGDNPSENDGHIYEFRVDADVAPTADFTWSQRFGSQTVDFTDTSSGLPTQWSWDFGDSTGSSAQNPSHTYAIAATYTVSVTATNNFGSDTKTRQVVVTQSGSNTNLLQNASFESADGTNHPTTWNVIPEFTRSSAVAHDGTFSGRLAANDVNVSTYQTVSVTAGTAYGLVGWVNIPLTGDVFSVKFKVQWRNSSGAISTVVLKKVADDTAGAWQQVTASSAVAPAGATSARVLITADSLIGPAYVDEVWFGQP
ncbi:MAG TPA: PKD domain-containing protein [Candidatus Limnocylindria bacterium]